MDLRRNASDGYSANRMQTGDSPKRYAESRAAPAAYRDHGCNGSPAAVRHNPEAQFMRRLPMHALNDTCIIRIYKYVLLHKTNLIIPCKRNLPGAFLPASGSMRFIIRSLNRRDSYGSASLAFSTHRGRVPWLGGPLGELDLRVQADAQAAVTRADNFLRPKKRGKFITSYVHFLGQVHRTLLPRDQECRRRGWEPRTW